MPAITLMQRRKRFSRMVLVIGIVPQLTSKVDIYYKLIII